MVYPKISPNCWLQTVPPPPSTSSAQLDMSTEPIPDTGISIDASLQNLDYIIYLVFQIDTLDVIIGDARDFLVGDVGGYGIYSKPAWINKVVWHHMHQIQTLYTIKKAKQMKSDWIWFVTHLVMSWWAHRPNDDVMHVIEILIRNWYSVYWSRIVYFAQWSLWNST